MQVERVSMCAHAGKTSGPCLVVGVAFLPGRWMAIASLGVVLLATLTLDLRAQELPSWNSVEAYCEAQWLGDVFMRTYCLNKQKAAKEAMAHLLTRYPAKAPERETIQRCLQEATTRKKFMDYAGARACAKKSFGQSAVGC